MEYDDYILHKTQLENNHGFEPLFMPDFLYDFQKDLLEWAIRKGRAAVFADCGLGKTPLQLSWAQNIVQKTNGNVLILTPLAVGAQTEREAHKFGFTVSRSKEGEINSKIVITNYERLHYFNPSDFQGIVCDESSILKNFSGKIKQEITIFMRKILYRLLATATAAPNDFIELGTSSEALGYLGYMDMLNKFFKNEQNNSKVGRHYGEALKWRLKGHAHESFWKWVTSWARAIRKPSDLGYDDKDFILKDLVENDHMLECEGRVIDGMLPGIVIPAHGLQEQREERKATIKDRCMKIADIVNNKIGHSVIWCNLNAEGDLLEKLIKDSIQVSGRDTDKAKEEKLISFSNGYEKSIIIKPKIGAFGLNWQHCNHVTYFPTHSYEQYYQAIRRCLRFGQKKEVYVDLVYTEGDKNVIENLQRKQRQADEMFDKLVQEMNESINISNRTNFKNNEELPSWLKIS